MTVSFALARFLSCMLFQVQIFSALEEISQQHKDIDQYFVSRAFDLKVFKEHINPKNSKGLIDNIIFLSSLESLVARAIKFGSERNERQPACYSSLEIVEFTMLSLRKV